MVCGGASQLSISQWALAFAEAGLNVDKTIGDLFGLCGFALMMGISRTIYGKYGHMLHLKNFMKLSAVLCIIAYLFIGLSPWPWLSLIGCMLCGFSVGIFWPGTFSKAMFALLALDGDIGCSLGPTIVGMISGIVGNDFQAGLLCAIIFPIILLMGLTILQKQRRQQ